MNIFSRFLNSTILHLSVFTFYPGVVWGQDAYIVDEGYREFGDGASSQEGEEIISEREATFFDFMRGCIFMGGLGAGGTSMAVSNSGARTRDSNAVVIGAVTSCLIGGFIVADVYKKANYEASMELRTKNQMLKNQVWGLMHDLCVMKRQCGPDGFIKKRPTAANIPIRGRDDEEVGERENLPEDAPIEGDLLRLRSGN